MIFDTLHKVFFLPASGNHVDLTVPLQFDDCQCIQHALSGKTLQAESVWMLRKPSLALKAENGSQQSSTLLLSTLTSDLVLLYHGECT